MSELADLPNYQIATIALALLDGARRKVHTEEVAERSLALASDRFSWRLPKYREKGWPDKFIVKCALEDAQKKKHGSLVEGQCMTEVSKDGWRLTPAGAQWVKTHAHIFESRQGQTSERLPRQEAQRFLKQLKSQPLYRRFAADGWLRSPDPYQLTDMLNTAPDALPEVIRIKFQRLCSTAELVGDRGITHFLQACADAFPHLLMTGESGSRHTKE
jgi:hypothetical protein